MADAKENLVRVARELRRIGLVDAVFVRGTTVGSYITDPALEVRMATPAMFLAAKREAHHDRGAGDPMMSHDLTDIVSLGNGRASLPGEVRDAPPEPREFIRSSLRDLLAGSGVTEPGRGRDQETSSLTHGSAERRYLLRAKLACRPTASPTPPSDVVTDAVSWAWAAPSPAAT